MTLDQVFKLIEAGYTKEEIQSFDMPQEQEQPEPEQVKEPEQKQEPDPEPLAQPDVLKFLAGEFEKLNRSIQERNILGSDIPQIQPKTAEEVLADIIAPPVKKGGKTK